MTLLRALVALCIATALTAAPAAAAPGDLDSGFASGGIFTGSFMTTFPGHGGQPQGRDRLAGAGGRGGDGGDGAERRPPPHSVRVLRLTPQGAPDASFGTGGQLTLPFVGDVRLGGLVIDAQDRPIIAAHERTGRPTGRSRSCASRLGAARLVVQRGRPGPRRTAWPRSTARRSRASRSTRAAACWSPEPRTQGPYR